MTNFITLKAKNIYHFYDNSSHYLLQNINIAVTEGSVVALASNNNLETTCLLQIISGHSKPHSGSVSLGVSSTEDKKPDTTVAAIYSTHGFYPELSLLDNLYIGTALGNKWFLLHKQKLIEKAENLYKEFGFHLDWFSNCKSMNHQQRIEASLIRCFLVDASIYIFDALLDDLPPSARQLFFSKCNQLSSLGRTILFSTSIPEEVSTNCSHMLILRQGRVSLLAPPKILLTRGSIRCLSANGRESAKLAIIDELRHLFSEYKDPLVFAKQALQIPSFFISPSSIFCIFEDRSNNIQFISKLDLTVKAIDQVERFARNHFSAAGHSQQELKINEFTFYPTALETTNLYWGFVAIHIDSKNIPSYFPLDTFVKEFSSALYSLLSEQMLNQQLAQEQRLSSLGSLAGGLVHDMNNSLFSISGSAELLSLHATTEKQSLYIETILKVVSDTRELTSKLLSFSKKGGGSYVVSDLHTLLADSISIAQAPSNIKVTQSFYATQSYIECDVSEIRNAIVNIIHNAIHAIDPVKGHVQIMTYNFNNTVGEMDYEGNLLPDKSIVISIIDNGHGIPAEALKQIFDPFFSTRSSRGGVGLGLSVVYGTIKEHNGCFNVKSEVEHGTEFNIYLPVTDSQVNSTAVTHQPTKQFNGYCVLLCDDNKHVQSVFKQMLESFGIDVLIADNGVECLSVFNEFTADIDLVILDDIMPIMTGRECFYELKAKQPDLLAIMITGYRDAFQIEHLLKDGLLGIYKKPMFRNELHLLLSQFLKP